MTFEGNAPASAGDDNTLSMIAELRGNNATEPSGTEPLNEPAPEPTPAPATVEPAAPANTGEALTPEQEEAAAEARRNELLRSIAIDPELTNQYAHQQLYPQAPQPTHYAPPPQYAPPAEPQPPSLQQLFGEEGFDFSNPEHHKILIAQQFQELGNPMYEMLEKVAQRFEQADQVQAIQQYQKVSDEANDTTVKFLDTYAPGFSGIAEKLTQGGELSPIEEAVFNKAVNLESAHFEAYKKAGYRNPETNVQIRAQIAQKIGPEIQKYSKALGLVSQPRAQQLTPEQKQVMKQEMYVESSNAVPAATAGSFDKAHEKSDSLGMIRALRQR